MQPFSLRGSRLRFAGCFAVAESKRRLVGQLSLHAGRGVKSTAGALFSID